MSAATRIGAIRPPRIMATVDRSSDPALTARVGQSSPSLDDLAVEARAVLDAAWIGASSLPSRTLYPHQWSWD